MPLRVWSCLALAALACRPETSSTPPGATTAAPADAPIAARSAVMVRPGATVWLDAARTQPIELPEKIYGGGIAMIVVADHGATLEVDTATSVPCASMLVGDFALRMFVAEEDLRPITRAPIEHVISARHTAKIGAGAPVDGAGDEHWVEVYVGGGEHAKVPVAASDVVRSVSPPPAEGECRLVLENGKPAPPDLEDPALAASLVVTEPMYAGPTYHARKGAKVWWRDGTPAGTVAVGHTFTAPAATAGPRSCLPLRFAAGNTTTLCFETNDLTEGTAGQGTIGLGNVGLIGGGGGGGGGIDDSSSGFGGRGKPVPSVRQAKATVTGALDKDIVRRIVRSHINEIRHCYNQALVRNPEAKGRITIDATIDDSGKVVAATPQPTEMNDPDIGGCMAKAFLRWKFPKPTDGANVTVSYPFILEPG
jgi:hypothetical protein